MNIKLLDTVVLQKDIAEKGLTQGDLGAVVECYGPETFEVEFVTGSGKTQALVTLTMHDIRAVASDEIIAVRSLSAA